MLNPATFSSEEGWSQEGVSYEFKVGMKLRCYLRAIYGRIKEREGPDDDGENEKGARKRKKEVLLVCTLPFLNNVTIQDRLRRP